MNSGPWHLGDDLGIGTVNVICAAGILACWIGSALQVTWPQELPWLEGSIAALIIVAASNALWLVSGMAKIRNARAQVFTAAGACRLPITLETKRHEVYAVARTRTYHRRLCILLEGKESSPIDRNTCKAASLTPCRMCDP